MNGEIITVGSEILIGDIVNTHSQFLSQNLATYGVNVLWHTSVGDNRSRLFEIAKTAFERSDIVIFTGGLGPTKDDLTKEAVCESLGLKLVEDKKVKRQIEEYFKRINKEITKSNYKQALVPQGCLVLENENGTAPGLIIDKENKKAILLPGPPNELIPMFNNKVTRFLENLCKQTIISHNIYFFNIGESAVDEKLSDLLDGNNPTVGIYAKESEVRVRVTAKGKSKQECEIKLSPLIAEINLRLGDFIYGIDVGSMQNAVVRSAIANNKKIAVAESCTGGLIAQLITGVPGSSKVFEGGVVSYSNEVKNKVLKVNEDLLKRHGAVSEQVAEEMAKGVRELTGADIAVSTTGIAGPGGGTPQKPVGLVYLGISTNSGCFSKKLLLSKGIKNERENIRHRASLYALNELIKALRF